MPKIKALLVDDEFLALNLLENFINRLADIEIVAKVKSPVKALEILQNQPVDLLFLDIQMPTLSGTNLLKTLPHPPVTIFTTAYAEYAPLAFDLNAVDYLLKPFSFERFLQSINKAKQQLNIRTSTNRLPLTKTIEKTASLVPPTERAFIAVKVDGDIQKIYLDDIIYIEGLREYIRIVCQEKKKYITLESLKNMETMLPDADFMRIHKSYIIAKAKATKLVRNRLEIDNFHLPFSRSKRNLIIQEVFKGGQ
ncbi:LytR/AlgR family response regulator transcription factor [Aureispira anguillae]|uniref:LytTR family DNA-binding domain-containing protein n=1 Tax=Aureispira anguillae TaxID=2864201 RepID=A0A915YF27_9BACT|nr:LytTR family DNA-binding domain-containing protein [Aureispira anguillae]BDS11865.1 LytTR family DNA-binding domain-containing protein [Aureispira anguillae]